MSDPTALVDELRTTAGRFRADAARTGHAVPEALAVLLETTARCHAPAPKRPGVIRCTCGGCTCGELHWPCASVTAAIALARAITAEESDHA